MSRRDPAPDPLPEPTPEEKDAADKRVADWLAKNGYPSSDPKKQ